MHYQENFLCEDEARQLHDWLTSDSAVHWCQEQFRIFGRQVLAPRQLAWFGDLGVNYRYTGIDHLATGWPRQLTQLRERVCTQTGKSFNFVLLNRYRHGGDYMGWHRDDERGADPTIASLSLGAQRRFRIRSGPGDSSRAFDLASGSLLVLDGRQQHMLAKSRRKVGERINLTFRRIHER
jgi:alkylated DNA repair dioxygenase AlkB